MVRVISHARLDDHRVHGLHWNRLKFREGCAPYHSDRCWWVSVCVVAVRVVSDLVEVSLASTGLRVVAACYLSMRLVRSVLPPVPPPSAVAPPAGLPFPWFPPQLQRDRHVRSGWVHGDVQVPRGSRLAPFPRRWRGHEQAWRVVPALGRPNSRYCVSLCIPFIQRRCRWQWFCQVGGGHSRSWRYKGQRGNDEVCAIVEI